MTTDGDRSMEPEGISSSATAGGTVNGNPAQAAMEPIPAIIGRAFVEEYYNRLHKDPKELSNFYGEECEVIHCYERPVRGREAVRKRIEQHQFRNPRVRVSSIDSVHVWGYNGVLILVVGELENAGRVRKFVQNFLLVSKDSHGPGQSYHVCVNDVFRYLDGDSISEVAESEVADVKPKEQAALPAQKAVDVGETPAVPPIVVPEKQESPKSAKQGTPKSGRKQRRQRDRGQGPVSPPSTLSDEAVAAESVALSPTSGPAAELEGAPTREAAAAPPKDEVARPKEKLTWAEMVRAAEEPSKAQSGSGAAPVAPPSAPVTQATPQTQQVPPAAREATPPAPASSEDSRSSNRMASSVVLPTQIYVSRLPRRVDHSQLMDVFSKFGPVKKVSFKDDKFFAFVEFENSAAAQRALNERVIIENVRVNVEERVMQASVSAQGRRAGRARVGRGRDYPSHVERGGRGGGTRGGKDGGRGRGRGQ